MITYEDPKMIKSDGEDAGQPVDVFGNKVPTPVDENVFYQKVVLVVGPFAVMLILSVLVSVGLMGSYGITPRTFTVSSFLGLFTNCFFHANFGHFMANAIPFLLLAAILVGLSRRRYIWSSLYIALGSSLVVFIVGRNANHVGASSLILGFFAHLVLAAWLEGISNPYAMVMAVGVLFFYGMSMLATLFSTDATTSFEGHFAGFITGLMSAIHYDNKYPKNGDEKPAAEEWSTDKLASFGMEADTLFFAKNEIPLYKENQVYDEDLRSDEEPELGMTKLENL